MIDRILKVSEMPTGVREACVERGHSDDAEMTIREAMSEWAAWELGSRYWGYEAAEYIAAMATRNAIA